MTTETLEVAVVEEGSGTNRLIAAVNKLADGQNKLAAAVGKSTTATKAQGEAADRAAKQTDYLSRSLGGVNSAAGSLQGALAGVGAALSISKLISATDAYTNMSNKLRLVSTDQKVVNNIMNEAFNIAQKTGTSWEGVSTTYGKVSQTLRSMGQDQSKASSITLTIAQSLQLASTSAESAKAGLLQFEQGLASGVLRGEEFNSVVENTPGLALALAAGVKQSGAITVGQLRAMAENGELTSKIVVEALGRVGKNIDILASTSVPTIGQSLTRVNNAFIKYVGEADKANGFSAALAKGLTILAQNMDKVVPIALGLAGVLAFGAVASAVNSMLLFATTITTVVVPAIVSLTAAMLANPLIAAATLVAIGAAVVAFKAFGVSVSDIASRMGGFITNSAKAVSGVKDTGAAATATVPALDKLKTANDNAAGGYTGLASTASQASNAIRETATAGAATATSLTATGTGVAAVRNSFEVVTTSAQGTAKGFTEVTTSAAALPAGLAPVGTSTAAAAGGFQVLSMNANQTGEAVTRVGAVMPTASTSIASVGKAAETTGASAVKASEGIDKVGASSEATGTKAVSMSDGFKLASVGAVDLSKSADQAAKALDDLTAKQVASEKASKAFAEALKKNSAAFNAYGEELKDIKSYLADVKAAQDRLNKVGEEAASVLAASGKAAREHELALLGISDSADRARYSVGSLNDTVNDNTNALLSSGTAAERAARSYDGLGESIARAQSQRWTPGNDVSYTSGGGSTGSGGQFGGTGSLEIVVGGKTVGYLDLQTQGAAGAAINEMAMMRANVAQKALSGITVDDTNKAQVTAVIKQYLGPYAKDYHPAFATGGSFMVGGRGGTDSQRVAFRASPNERVTIETPEQVRRREESIAAGSSAGSAQPSRLYQSVAIKVVTNDYDGFRRNEKQIGQDAARRIRKAM